MELEQLNRNMKHYVYGALPDHHFRLLTIHPRKSHHGEIDCYIKTYSLAWSPSYTCLSYTWGDPSLTKLIRINGLIAPVTSNLFRALQDLSPAVEHTIWVDALCIDQRNIFERNKQVQIMRDIFGRAQRVVAWIGDSRFLQGQERWEQGASQFFNSLAAIKVNREPLWMQSAVQPAVQQPTMPCQASEYRRGQPPPDRSMVVQSLPVHYQPVQSPPEQFLRDPSRLRLVQRSAIPPRPPTAHPLFTKDSIIPYYHPVQSKTFVTPILETDWNTRAWVLQEAALAQELVLYWRGGEHIQWETFIAALRNMQQSRSAPSSHISSFLVKDDIRRRVKARPQALADDPKRQKVAQSTFRPIKWPHALSVASELKSTNPRDKIYSVIGLLDPADAGEFPARYEWSVRDLYVDFARYMLYKLGPEFLEHVDRNHAISEAMDLPTELHQLPSWAPDLVTKSCSGYHLRNKWSSRDSYSELLNLDVVSPTSPPEETPGDAAKESEHQRYPVSRNSKDGELIVELQGHTEDVIAEVGLVNKWHEARGESSDPGTGFIDALKDWLPVVMTRDHRAYVDLRRLMIEKISETQYYHQKEELEVGWDGMARAILSAGGKQLPDYLDNGIDNPFSQTHGVSPKPGDLSVKSLLLSLSMTAQIQFAKWNRGTLEMRMVITGNGHVGFVPSDARVGDTVAALPGLKVEGKAMEHPQMHRFVMRAEGDSWRLIGSCLLEKFELALNRDQLESFKIK